MSKEDFKQITEKTALPVSMVLVIVTAVVWFVRLEGRVDANSDKLKGTGDLQKEMINQQEKTNNLFRLIEGRLGRIEGRLGVRSPSYMAQ
jgi:hypothetical protein